MPVDPKVRDVGGAGLADAKSIDGEQAREGVGVAPDALGGVEPMRELEPAEPSSR